MNHNGSWVQILIIALLSASQATVPFSSWSLFGTKPTSETQLNSPIPREVISGPHCTPSLKTILTLKLVPSNSNLVLMPCMHSLVSLHTHNREPSFSCTATVPSPESSPNTDFKEFWIWIPVGRHKSPIPPHANHGSYCPTIGSRMNIQKPQIINWSPPPTNPDLVLINW